jgi:uncharacterized membrane protein YhaH (DUF805 family)
MAEIASDLWEQATHGGLSGESPKAVAAHIFGRTVLGMPSDVAWHMGELKGVETQMSGNQKMAVGAFVFLGVNAIIFSVMLVVNGIDQGWLFNNPIETVLGLIWIVFGLGPFIALAGVYSWRRADAERRSTKKARTMIVAGTLGIAGVAGMMWWTILGPIIAIAIVGYWVEKIGQWRNGDDPKAA